MARRELTDVSIPASKDGQSAISQPVGYDQPRHHDPQGAAGRYGDRAALVGHRVLSRPVPSGWANCPAGSDNTAGNLLLGQLGGPAGLTAYARSLGDRVTRLERAEPTLNEARPGDPRDTTSPRAIAADYQAILLGTALKPSDRALVVKWMKGSTTGAGRIRAAVPSDWMAGDKSGTGGFGTDNDVAILWPPQRPPLILAVMSTRSSQSAAPDNALVATAARMVLGAIGVLT